MPDSNVRLHVVHSIVHTSSEGKITSLTLSDPTDNETKACFITFSDKVDKIRVKLSMDEIAGLAKCLNLQGNWEAYHTFNETSTRIQYNDPFINATREGKKIAVKLSRNERSAFELALTNIFNNLCRK